MSRYFAIQTWVGSHENEPEYNGNQCGERNVRSVEIPTFDRRGRPNINAFSDAAIEARKEKRKTSIPLADRILPQAKRVRLLTEQLYELEAERKNGMDVHTYSQLRDILICKRSRAEELLKKAVSVKPTQPDEDDIDLYTELPEDEAVFYATNDVSPQRESDIGCQWIDDLSSENSLKKPLKIACTLIRTAVRWHQASKRYIQTLKEV